MMRASQRFRLWLALPQHTPGLEVHVVTIKCTSGIYCIRCVPTGKVYVGQASRLRVRWNHHRRRLILGKHRNKPLQNAWNKYGPDAFDFEVLEEVEAERLTEREDHFINLLEAAHRDHGFNRCPAAESLLGIKHGPYARERVEAVAAKLRGRPGKPISEERKVWLSALQLGRRHTAETREKCRAAKLGKKQSPEAIAKSAASRCGMKPTPETRAKISAAQKGRINSPETRAKISARCRAKWADPEYRAMMSAMRKGKKPSPEAIAKTAAANRGKKYSPERVARARAARWG